MMQIVERDRGYPELLESLRGRKVLIWTCNTCARLCNGVGGETSAERLSERLSADGIGIAGVLSISASCIIRKIESKKNESGISDYDIVLALTCDIGARCARDVFGCEVLNPVRTLGPGLLDGDGIPVTADGERTGKMMSPYSL